MDAAAAIWLGNKLLANATKDVFSLFTRSSNKDVFDKTVVVEWDGRRFWGS